MNPNLLKHLTILIVDDELDLLAMTRTRLEIDGAEVQQAENGAVALVILEKSKFDIIITDIRMPLVDGKELVKRIRMTDKVTPVICMSGFSDFSYKEILAWGANQHFSKPLPIDDLIGKILLLTKKSKAS